MGNNSVKLKATVAQCNWHEITETKVQNYYYTAPYLNMHMDLKISLLVLNPGIPEQHFPQKEFRGSRRQHTTAFSRAIGEFAINAGLASDTHILKN